VIDSILTNRYYTEACPRLIAGCLVLMCLCKLSFLIDPVPCDFENLQPSEGQYSGAGSGIVSACLALQCRSRSLRYRKALSQVDTGHLNGGLCDLV
jgi:hypothetical protein